MSIETQIENLTNAVENLTKAFVKFIPASVSTLPPEKSTTEKADPPQEKPKATRKRRTKAEIAAAKAAEEKAAEQPEENAGMDDDFLSTNEAPTPEDVHEALMKVVQHPGLGPKVAKKLVADAGAKKVGGIAEDKRQGVIDAINAELKEANA